MSRIAFTSAIVAALAFGSVAFAQSATTQSNANQPGMADTTSDSGNLGTGASSSKIGTGSVSHGATGNGSDHTGVVGPAAPATTGHGASGANANSSGGVSN